MSSGPRVTRLLVVGGSAGGVDALQRFVAELPADLPAAVLVTLHLGRDSPGLLAEILDRHCALPVLMAEADAPLLDGVVIVARSDRHLVVVDDRVRLGLGARDHHHRPSLDVLLSSAALSWGPAVVGVVLTGMLDDGAVGLRRVVRAGGTALVQDPQDALFPAMPAAALTAVPGATCRPVEELAREAVRLLTRPVPAGRPAPVREPTDRAELLGWLEPDPGGDGARAAAVPEAPEPAEAGPTTETALREAVHALEERAQLSTRLGEDAETAGRAYSRAHFQDQARDSGRAAGVLRRLLREHRDRLRDHDPAVPDPGSTS